MIFGVFFKKEIVVKKIDESINYGIQSHYFSNDNIYINRNSGKFSFELGFYNWLIGDEGLIGINFQILSPLDSELEKKVIELHSHQILVNENGINFFFKNISKDYDYWIDYVDRFLDFYLLTNSKGEIALTFSIPDKFEYNLGNVSNG